MRLFLFFIAALGLWVQDARAFVPDGYCTIVLSSRPTADAALADVRNRWSGRDITIYKSGNGWFAITSRVIPMSRQQDVLAAEKAAGRIPPDALCSGGKSYVRRVSQIAANTGASANMWSPADVYAMSGSDQRFIQLGLAFEGHYHGLLDGKWGRLSQRALEAYSAAEFSALPENWHLASLAFGTFTHLEQDGWEMFHNEWLDMSYIFPFSAARKGEETDTFLNYEHVKSSLRFSFGRGDDGQVNRIHSYVLDAHRGSSKPYSVRRDNWGISSAKLGDGTRLYARSRFVGGQWSTVMISAHIRDQNLFQAVTASIGDGFAPAVIVQKNGYLDRQIQQAIAFVERNKEEPAAPAPATAQVTTEPRITETEPEIDPKTGAGSGTGFVVAQNGAVLTNAHVVEGCSRIRIDGLPAIVKGVSEDFDLALLQVSSDKQWAVAGFAGQPAGLNSDVTVVGYPLSGILGGLNVTRGSVSSLKGLAGDITKMQISAPIQPGNSGGPVVDASGEVVGVVVSKLDERKFSDATGVTPQNINFAIRSEIAKLFLFQNGVEPHQHQAKAPVLSPTELAQRAAAFTVMVDCN